MKDLPLVVSIVVHYNTPEDCINLLYSLKQLIYLNHRIIVVDNCSEETAYSALNEFITTLEAGTACEIIKNNDNVGFGGGVNYGCEYAVDKYKASYFHVINSDAEVVNLSYLQHLITVLEQDKSIAIVGPAVLKESKKELQNTILPFVSLRTALSFKKAYSNLSYVEDQPKVKDVECVNGVCFVVRASVFCSVGGFDTSYFMYGEEQDLCYKIFLKGHRRVFWPGLSIVHLGAEKLNTYSIDWRYVNVRKNQVKFLRKHDSLFTAFILATLFSVKTSLFYIRNKGNSDQCLSSILMDYFGSLK